MNKFMRPGIFGKIKNLQPFVIAIMWTACVSENGNTDINNNGGSSQTEELGAQEIIDGYCEKVFGLCANEYSCDPDHFGTIEGCIAGFDADNLLDTEIASLAAFLRESSTCSTIMGTLCALDGAETELACECENEAMLESDCRQSRNCVADASVPEVYGLCLDGSVGAPELPTTNSCNLDDLLCEDDEVCLGDATNDARCIQVCPL